VRVRGRAGVCCGVATLCVMTMTGCGTQSGAQDVSGTVARFFEATAGADGAAACALLAPKTRDDLTVSDGQPCAESLPMDRLHGTAREASVWSGWAYVSTDQGAVFLTEFESGWLITAAGCQPNGDAPYRCVVGG
jgi:hypothetical protein